LTEQNAAYISRFSPASGKRRRMPSTVQKRVHVQYIRETDVLRSRTRLQTRDIIASCQLFVVALRV